jgi:beta-glucosidase
LELPVIPHSDQRLAEVELPPFVASIAAGVDSVMMAHLLIPAWDSKNPATLSPVIVQEQLRQRLGFQGLVVTDALVMGAIAKLYTPEEAAILAVEAGADVLLMPLDPQVTIDAVCTAVKEGRISRERIEASVQRIRQAKAKVFPDWQPNTPYSPPSRDPQKLFYSLSQPSSQVLVQTILQDSLKQGGTLPLVVPNSPQPCRNLVIVDDLLNCSILGNHTPAIARPTQLGYRLQLIDCHDQEFSDLEQSSEPTLLQIFIRANAFRDSSGLTQIAQNWLNILLKQDHLQALVIYGSPYTLEQFLPQISPKTPYVFSYGQTPAAQEIALKVLWGI